MKTAFCGFLITVCLVVAIAQERPSEISGYITNQNNSPVKGVVVSIGSISVASTADGYYRMAGVRPGSRVVTISPPGKPARAFRVSVGSNPTRQDFRVDW